jgi:hypothetical protein
MKLSFFAKKVGHGLLGALGFGVAMGGVVSSSQAAMIVNPGTDYLRTPPGGSLFCLQPGPNPGDPCAGLQLSFSGLPIGTPTALPPDGGYLGQADTVVNRNEPVDPMKDPSYNPITGLPDIGESTDIEIIGLSLKGDTIVSLSGISGMPDGTTYNYYAGLQKYYPATRGGGADSLGDMFIRDNGIKTWDSQFVINGVLFFVPTSTPIVPGTDFVRRAIEHFTTDFPTADPMACTNSEYTEIKACSFFTSDAFKAFDYPWSYEPLPDQILGRDLVGPDDNNFYLSALSPKAPPDTIAGGLVRHVAPNHIHDVTPRLLPAPSPLGVLGLPALAATVGRLKKLSSILRQSTEVI